MSYYISVNNEYVKETLDKKRNELVKAVKEAIGAAFQKGSLTKYDIDFFMFNGSLYAEIKETKEAKILLELKNIDINPEPFSWDLDKKIAEFDKSINEVKNFTQQIKKLK